MPGYVYVERNGKDVEGNDLGTFQYFLGGISQECWYAFRGSNPGLSLTKKPLHPYNCYQIREFFYYIYD